MIKRNKQHKKKFITFDRFVNHATNMGLGSKNSLSYTEYAPQNITINYEFLCNLYQSNWVAKRIVDVIPEDMMSKGYDFNTQLTPQVLNEIKLLEGRLQLNEKILQGLQYARLFGKIVDSDSNQTNRIMLNVGKQSNRFSVYRYCMICLRKYL